MTVNSVDKQPAVQNTGTSPTADNRFKNRKVYFNVRNTVYSVVLCENDFKVLQQSIHTLLT